MDVCSQLKPNNKLNFSNSHNEYSLHRSISMHNVFRIANDTFLILTSSYSRGRQEYLIRVKQSDLGTLNVLVDHEVFI